MREKETTDSDLNVDRSGGVLTMTMNRPERRNAITTVMLAEMIHCLEQAQSNPDVRVVVLRGAGAGFCPGDDLRGMGPLPDDFPRMPTADVSHAQLQTSLRELGKPTIAAIHGFAFGVGLDLAMACDFRVATEDARLQDQRVIERGMHAVTGCAWFHARAMGTARALEFLILGEPLSGREAKGLGMVTQAVTSSEFEESVTAMTDRFAAAPTKAIGLMKRQIYAGENMSHLEFMAFAAPLIKEVEIKDREEGIRAFLEKRSPHFTGE